MAPSAVTQDLELMEFRKMLPTQSRTALAIDGHQSMSAIAAVAVAEGYIDESQHFDEFVHVCVSHGATGRCS